MGHFDDPMEGQQTTNDRVSARSSYQTYTRENKWTIKINLRRVTQILIKIMPAQKSELFPIPRISHLVLVGRMKLAIPSFKIEFKAIQLTIFFLAASRRVFYVRQQHFHALLIGGNVRKTRSSTSL